MYENATVELCLSLKSKIAASMKGIEYFYAQPRIKILDFESHGWLAIDPKGLFGERAFDFANIFCNPDHTVAAAPGRLQQQVDLIPKLRN